MYKVSRSPRQLMKCGSLAAVAATLMIVASPAHADETGLWYDDSGRGAVEVVPCADRLCGFIVWLQDPLDSKGKPLRDIRNPEPSGRNRPICGIQVLGDLKRQPDGTWDQGWVYDPKVGKSYNVAISLADANNLTVHGYAGVKLFGKKLRWTRAPADLPRCDQKLDAIRAGQ